MTASDPELLQKAMDVFAQVYDLPADKRREALAQKCEGRPELVREVESLLAQHDQPNILKDERLDDVLGRAIESAREDGPWDDSPQRPPQHIGGYQVIRTIGEGGMGTVYEAEQEQPRRRVALKVIRPGWMSRELLKRFQFEAHVLGQLDHPGIARIYEAFAAEPADGESAGAQPFFAMELVRGRSLLQHAQHHELSISERLELMAEIADAVHHAHQKGVVHRDLKPSNILVTDGGQPKVLDFGVARALSHESQLTTYQTRSGELIGTIAYMSPEQVAGDPAQVDTRADIYALGVILYELLGHRLPIDVTHCPLPEATRLIQETDPPRLSSISTRFRGDIDTIVGKTLEKDVARRYQSAADFAADLRRTLRDEPITARPPSASYQFRKFARRNRALVGGVAATFAALLLGLIGTITFAVGMARQLEETERQQELAEARFDDVRDLANTFLFEVEQQIRGISGTTAARESLVSTGLEYLDSLAAQTEGDRDLLLELAVAYRQMGSIQGGPGAANLGDTSGARESYNTSLVMLEDLRERVPDDEDVFRGLISSRSALARLELSQENLDAALSQFMQVLEQLEQRRDREGTPPDLFAGQIAATSASIGQVKRAMGMLDEAVEYMETYREFAKSQHEQEPSHQRYALNLAMINAQLGYVHRRRHAYEESNDAYSESLRMFDRIIDEYDDPEAVKFWHADTRRNFGFSLRDQGRYDEAMEQIEIAHAINRELIEADPLDVMARLDYVRGYFARGYVHERDGDLEGARDQFQAFNDAAEALVEDAPDVIEHHLELRRATERLGATLLELGQYEEAAIHLRKGVEIAERILERVPDSPSVLRASAHAHEYLGMYYYKMTRHADNDDDAQYQRRLALEQFEKALGRSDQIKAVGPLLPMDQQLRDRVAEVRSKLDHVN